MTVKGSTHGPFQRGLDASAGVLSQPKGTVPRMSNLLLTKRGSLHTCDGSLGIHEFNGVPTLGRGKMLVIFLFQPTGVSNYYLVLAQALDLPLGAPQNLGTADGGAGGSLPVNVTARYRVTAIDGVGGETLASPIATYVQASPAHKVILTWNVVPNAAGYNIYSDRGSGSIFLLIASGLPVPQPSAGSLTATYTDDGSPVTSNSFTVTQASLQSATSAIFTTTGGTPALGIGITYAGGSVAGMNIVWTVTGIPSSNTFIATGSPTGVPVGTVSTGGTVTTNPTLTPFSDTTQQIVLFKMPVIAGSSASLPVSYNNSNIVALFPALLSSFTSVGGGGGGSGGGGGTGGGGSGGGGGTGGGRLLL